MEQEEAEKGLKSLIEGQRGAFPLQSDFWQEIRGE